MTAERDALAEAIRYAINTNSAENASNTPDYILAQFMCACLAAFNTAVQQRETWHGRDARPSLAAPAQESRRFDVFRICDAYESGIGHGLKRDGLCNPYPPESDDFRAYDIGYEEGAKRAIDVAAPAQGEPVCEHVALSGRLDKSAQGEPQDCDALIARLRATRMDRDNFPRMDSERWLPVGLAREAADAIAAVRAENERQAREIAKLERLLTDGGHTRALRAEAERDGNLRALLDTGAALLEVEAERDVLRAAIREHNDGLQQMCDAQAATGRCDAWRSRGKSCVDCPRDFVVDAARAGEGK